MTAAPPAADPTLPRPFRLVRTHRETRDVVSLVLAPASGGAPPAIAPGQFHMLYVFGVGEVPISVSGDTDAGERVVVHTVRAVGAVSAALCALGVGDIVGVRGPFGHPWPVDDACGDDLLLVAGGIGLAPLRPVLYRALARRRDYGRVALIYGARTPADLLYADELHGWRGQFGLQVEVIVDSPGDARSSWFGPVGVVTRLLDRVEFEPIDTTACICGPEVVIRFAAAGLVDRGVPADKIHVALERNLKCAIGLCGHCQLGPAFVCKDGSVFAYPRVAELLGVRQL